MKIPTVPCSCSICGGPGVTSIRNAAATWNASAIFTHRDPRICQDYLAQKAKEKVAKCGANGGD